MKLGRSKIIIKIMAALSEIIKYLLFKYLII